MTFWDIGHTNADLFPLVKEGCKYLPEEPFEMETIFYLKSCDKCVLALKIAITVKPPDNFFQGWYEQGEDIKVAIREGYGIEL